MKSRNGFVSNSSSSSFVVAVKNEKSTSVRVKIETDIDLANYSDAIIKTVEDLNRYYRDELCWDDYAEREDYQEAVKAINKGKVVVFGNFSSEGDEPIERFLCNTGLKKTVKDKNVQIIQSEEGY